MILDLPPDFIQTIQNAFKRKGQRWLDTLPGLLAEALLHGDFHHFNVFKSARGWLAIDPKGVIGPRGYEVGSFLINPGTKILKRQQSESTNREAACHPVRAVGYGAPAHPFLGNLPCCPFCLVECGR